ncbi:MAG: hypothetical protein BHV92_02850 [Clostridiales bacterium 45_37]|jgi:type I restriction enzyme S subunit|uniref:restriction endonuclease subunit S n=1 Tax=Faecalibacterium taiwanense TaxID=3030638 RepID=UPI000969C7B7|nr:MAG: hypothetical protein BHV92_02850 [Clostridiales bacterium 45_37]
MRYTIGQLAEIIDGDRGKNYPKQDEFYPQGYCLFLNTGNVTKEGLIFEENQFITKEKDEALRKGKLKRGDIVYTTRGTVGNAGYYNSNVPYENVRINSGMVILRANVEIVDARFLYQILKSEYYRPYFKQYCTGSAQPQLPIKNFSQIYLNVPDIKTQHRIADIVSAYDDLIKNNQRQIKLLEEAAQRLYKEWFVDLRFPGHENTKIVDGVPEGWRVASIADICDTVGGGTPSTKIQSYYEKGDILWVTPTDITRNFSLALLDTEKKITPEGLKNSSANMLPAETILMTSRASVGFFGMCKYEVCTNQGFISCIPKRENLQMYLLFNLKSRVEEIRQKAGGSTYLEISKTVFRELKIILPKDEVLAEYQKNVHDIFDEIYCRTEMIKSLVDMRNRLLPKLMSGEVEV